MGRVSSSSHLLDAHRALLVVRFLADVVHRVERDHVDQDLLVEERHEQCASRRLSALVDVRRQLDCPAKRLVKL